MTEGLERCVELSLFSFLRRFSPVAPASQGAGLGVTGNDTFVIVRPTGDVAQALPLAEQHCTKYVKDAHFTQAGLESCPG